MTAVLHRLDEETWQAQVLDLCRHLHLLAYHTHNSQRSVAGYPDLTIVGPAQLLFVELKTDTGRLSPEQRRWLRALARTGHYAAVWRPKNWTDTVIPTLQAIARSRPAPTPAHRPNDNLDTTPDTGSPA